MQEIIRINNRSYTDSDALAFYIRHREEKNKPFIREVGDFIAHRERDSGAILRRCIYAHAQWAFILRHQPPNARIIEPKGECPWWFKSWLRGRLEDVPNKVMLKNTGLSLKDAREKISRWFENGEAYPTEIHCSDPITYHKVMHLFERGTSMIPAFKASEVKREILLSFREDGIDPSEGDPFIIATCILLAGKSCALPNGFSANLHLQVDPEPRVLTDDLRIAESWPDGYRHAVGGYSSQSPDGEIRIMAHITDPELGNIVPVVELLNTGINSKSYVSRRLIQNAGLSFALPHIELSGLLHFDRSLPEMVFRFR